MKTAMQICLEKFMVEISNEDAEKLLQAERQQIVDAFDNGKSRAYATADGECEVKFGFQFYAEIYNVQPH